ncbi:MAG TPA: hypothetical protein VMW03_01190 [Candidatus Krumholzibacteriaceae bacterium]|nr:hypothetical protein [Candidatus Krumholzibacteriaceae bacterium]
MEQATDVRVLQLGNALSFAAVVVVNALANILPLNNVTTAELSDSYPNYFVPAGYVFTIWGVIYLLLLGFTVRQLRRGGEEAETLRKIGWLFMMSSVFNVVWIFLWHWRQVALSLVAMFGLLASLIGIYLRLDIGRAQASRDQRIYYHLPFSVYLGWITVAPIANIVAFLVSSGWESYGVAAAYWTVLVIAVALALTLVNLWTRGDVAYSLVIVWALSGIVYKQLSEPLIPYAAGLGALVIIGGIGLDYVKRGGL